MSVPTASSPGSGPTPSSLTPFLKALQSGDLETLSKLRHALRTPLNQIIGYSEMLMESAQENNAQAILPDLKRIHSSGGQLLAVINDALAPWKIDTGKIDFPAMRQAMRAPLAAAVTQAGLSLDQARASGHVELVKDLEKILTAARNLEKLFESDAYSEEVIVGRPAGEGNTESPLGAIVSPVAGDDDFGISAQPMPSAKLLAVDDDPMNRDMLSRRLEKLGYEVTDAATGREALQKLKDGNFDLVLLDILMPDLDGFQTLEFMKADPRLRHVPVIMLTALDDVASTVRCIEAGAEDYVPKPFNPTVLRARITASLEKKRLRDQEQAFLAQLQIERSKSERLLLNVLPKAIAERLKAGQRTIVDSFIDSTVLFADIVGFTRIAARQSPHRTVQLLNELFSGFDRIAEQRELEKVKTIGDAYMLASGVPVIRADHAEACAEAAFEFVEAVRTFNRRHQLDWAIRVGMNSGPVVAGIIGTKKFSYDLWGDTVNIASRMESHGQPGKIQVSEATKKLLDRKYDFTPVGVIEIKNSSPMPTYLLARKGGK
ncbi:adenylate/guanylate cyclase domain-containing protein [Opitutus sp. GAS368]|uniref:adenylate/guanylate cyclase domain-containing protein n=1 Tax=Opitutus sp. GAS368 TaxID=1882749 RepID=UPI00087CACA3|nr:adenylate/guanylate cyclase domain-containing protein [Opitutus sp. GAS368]SDS54149.1 His Kinase A (phospho-acceptor) domain-containing protein [Opitutus sp. GAS368]